MPKRTLIRCDDLVTILDEIDAQRSTLAMRTPEQQRLTMLRWIARARAAASKFGGRAADEQVCQIARALQALGQLWWPGTVLALSPTTPPTRALAGAPGTWETVAALATVHLEKASGWADDHACSPRPRDCEAMLDAAATTLSEFGGPLGTVSRLDIAEMLDRARRQIPDLVRLAGELRWLRGAVPALAWAAAIGRLRGLVRQLGRDGASIAAVLDPAFTPASWARHLGRNDALASVPCHDCDVSTLIDWLIRAFDVFDNPELVPLCRPLESRILELRPELPSRRYRRRLVALQHGLANAVTDPEPVSSEQIRPNIDRGERSLLAQARRIVSGRRALFISNRSYPELVTRLDQELGLACDAVASVAAPRRRQALLRRIRGGSYDLVLVAHEFSSHADTEQVSEACKSAGVFYCAVGKGRFNKVLSRILDAGHRSGFAKAEDGRFHGRWTM